ncbi:hypothetical protein gpAD87_23500 [Paenibacillus sp. AD87]|nr:hypothetical protein gpAD87_23500 [Paenibacillus sp. AD87]
MVETIGVLRIDVNAATIFIVVPLLICNAYQMLILHRLVDGSMEQRGEWKDRGTRKSCVAIILKKTPKRANLVSSFPFMALQRLFTRHGVQKGSIQFASAILL